MKFQIVLSIFIMGINFSNNKAPKQHCYQSEKVYIKSENIPKIRSQRSLQRNSPVIRPKQNGVCSTWGNFQYRTFDGAMYRFAGICNYLFAAHCGSHYEDFNIQIEQSWDESLPTVSQLSVKLNELLIEVNDHNPSISGELIDLPYSHNGIRIEKIETVLHISAKFLLELTWEESNIIHLTLNKKYMGETCGLCGNYNGNANDDIVYEGNVIDPILFGELYKFRKPEQNCQDPKSQPTKGCQVYRPMCMKHLKNYKWKGCNRLINPDPYVEAYMLDMCLCSATTLYRSFCLCGTITEYSRQCALAGGRPPEWRNANMCYKSCPHNLIYKECSAPCISTCSNPGQDYFCDGPCVSGCVCPKGLVLDDVTNLGCIPVKQCSCTYNNDIYPSGTFVNSTCRSCLCSGGHWNCRDVPCPSTCAVEGGSHITTFDNTQYTFHGKCVYVLTKPCANNTFSVNIEMKKCAYSDSGTCLTNVFLYLDDGFYEFQITYDNIDFPHVNFNKQRMATAGVHIFWPSSFFLIMQTNKGLYLQVQLMPTMQLYVVLDPSYKEKMCGLCGNFNSIQKDDFRTSSGVLESNAVDFANTWRTNFKCKPITPVHEHPCIYGMEKEKYASYWCNTLLEPEGPFALCHSSVNPTNYHQNCMFDTCSCKRAEDCLCAAISSYVWACAAAGVRLSGWREDVCRIFLYHCPPSFVYSYTVTSCIPTCRSLFEPDLSCSFTFHTVDGCVCPNGTYLNDRGVCVKREDCPCYYKGVPVPTNEPLNVGRLICTCTKGTIQCADQGIKECPPPMVYFDCEKAGEKAKGAECSQTCESTTVQCYSPLCVSGCLCPKGLVLSENSTCIKEEECPCVHNGKNYKSGDVTRIHCNQCVCRNKTWVCERNSEKGICTLYGDGHYITFDNKRYTINGDCEYILVQDYCDIDHLWKGTFKIISENIPCGTTGTSCSKAITVYLGSHKLILADGKFEVLKRSSNIEIPYKTRRMGLFLIIETGIGLVLVWDHKTNINIHLNTNYKGMVCGLCGDFDGNGNNDFTTRSQCVVEDVKEFRDSWKVSPNCPEVYITKDPCVVNPYRLAWAQKMCNILLSSVFAPCHSEVDPEKYYEACIKDSCACDMGGDCECYCTAVSVYAQACSEACVCIEWRSPTVCPLSCDSYNPGDECTWHYKACGARCMKTCRNPKGLCMSNLKGLEGCYPKCPKDKPYFNEDEMRCVSQCGCLDKEETYYRLGEEVESCNVCEICNCTSKGIVCYYDSKACNCVYNGQLLKIGEIIELDDSFGGCKKVFCGLNGTIEAPCYTTTETQTGFLQTTIFRTSISLLETSTSLPALSNASSTTTKSQESETFTETLFSSLPSQRTEVKSTSTSRKITSSTTKASLKSATSIVPSKVSTTSSTIISPVSQQTTLLPTKITTSASLETTRATTLSSAAGSSAVQFTEPVRSTNVTPPLNTTGLISSLETKTQTLTTFGLTKLSTGSLQTTRFPVEKTTSTTIGKPTSSVIASKTLPQFSTHTPSGETSTSSTTESLSETTPFTLELSGTGTAGTEISEPLITDNEVIPPTGLVETFKPITTSQVVIVHPTINDRCANITCNTNGTLSMAKVYCPEVEQITCVGGSPPIKIYDQNGCCFYYECTHCVGPHGIMKKPGDAWIDNCRYCKCDSYFEKDSMKSKISCQPLKCPPLDFNACEKPWLTPYFTYTEEDRCCPRIHCLCEPFYCEQQTETCSLGYEAVPSIMEGECCATINCKPMDVCIQNGSIYQIGQEISVNRLSCKQCRCSGIKDLKTGFNTIVCESILCMKHCPQGFAYEPSNDGCCGTCIQESCIVIATDGSRHLLKPGESQFLLGDNCTEYTCELSGKTFMTSSKTKVCPITNEGECTSGSFEKTPDGCCSICRVPQTCTVKTNVTTIFQNGCSANVSLSYCEGWCPSSRKFSEMSLRMEGECVCCLEVETTEMEIELICPGDMDNIKMTLLSASTCACSSASCTV